MVINHHLSIEEKLRILSDAAKYDVACTSSGVDRKGEKGKLGSSVACGICHSFSADGRCISLLKILMTNECIYNCKYCINGTSNDVVRTTFTPDEICTLTMEFYRRNYIEGLFLSSGILKSPDHTMELLYITLLRLRRVYQFNGYIHVKGIPGADPALIEEIGYLADRMSVNLELPTAEGLRQLAPNKTRQNILTPMRQIQRGIRKTASERQPEHRYLFSADNAKLLASARSSAAEKPLSVPPLDTPGRMAPAAGSARGYLTHGRPSSFVPAGQSTQIIIGATPETDYQLVSVAQALYRNFDLKRVFYSSFINVNQDSSLPDTSGGPALLREHRLYQADWLMRFYGFEADELLSEQHPNFNVHFDPKCDWALHHLEFFPVEINSADYAALLRVPGIGVRSARRIIQARRETRLDFPALKRLGVVLKRAHYFLTCSGRMMYPTPIDYQFIASQLTASERCRNWEIAHRQQNSFRQLSLFDDFGIAQPGAISAEPALLSADTSSKDIPMTVTRLDRLSAISGQL